MKPVDTHCHLQFEGYDKDREEVVKRTSKELEFAINVGTSVEASKKGIDLANKIPNFYASIGVHPHHVGQWSWDTVNTLETVVKENKVIAVGEIGLDNHQYQGYPEPNLDEQREILEPQIELAFKEQKPILFHCRKAYDELHEFIKKHRGKLQGLVHCFMGTSEQAKKFLDLGLYISFAGNLTYKKNGYIREAAKNVPSDKLLIETDSPFLPPEPHRGMRNEPIYVKIIASEVASVRDWSLEKTLETTTENAKKLFFNS